MRSRRGLTFCLAAVLGTAACASGAPPAAAPGGALPEGLGFAVDESDDPLRIAVPSLPVLDPTAADPMSAVDLTALDLLADGLTAWDAAATTAVPALAVSWEVAADGGTWTFRLDPAATFSDGRPVRAADVVASLERVRALGPASIVAAGLGSVGTVTAIDDRTVEVALAAPLGDLPELLTHPFLGVFPADAAPGVASGPYTLVQTTADTVVFGDRGEALRPQVSFALADDPAGAVVAGEAAAAPQGTGPVPEGAALLVASGDATVWVGIRLRADGATADPLLRGALVAAIDRTVLAPLLPGGPWVATDSLVPPTLGGEPCGSPCAANPGMARDVVGDAELPTFVIGVPGDAFEATGEAIADALGAAGVPSTLVVVPVEEYADRLTAGDLDVFVHGTVATGPTALAGLRPFASASPENVTGWADATTDALLAAADLAPAPERDLAGIEARLRAGAVAVPIARAERGWLTTPGLGGVTVAADGRLVVG
jgi:peptide/nickel transport system substrate-binding protein